MKKVLIAVLLLFLVSNLFADYWIFNDYGEKDKADTPNFFILFSDINEAEQWLLQSNKKISELRELEPLLSYLKNDMVAVAKSGYILIECWKNSSPVSDEFIPCNYYIIP